MSQRHPASPHKEERLSALRRLLALLGSLLTLVGLGWFLRRNDDVTKHQPTRKPTAPRKPLRPGEQAPPEPAELDENVVGRPARMPDPEDIALGYEQEDADIRGVLRAGVGVLLLVIASVVITSVVLWGLSGQGVRFSLPPLAETGDETITLTEGEEYTIPTGVDDTAEGVPYGIETRRRAGEEYAEYRASEEQMLGTYGWVDEAAGLARIPIHAAMEQMVAENAFPVRAGSEATDPAGALPSDSSSGRMMERTREWLNAESPE